MHYQFLLFHKSIDGSESAMLFHGLGQTTSAFPVELTFIWHLTMQRGEVKWLVHGGLCSDLFAACVAAKWWSESMKSLQLLLLIFDCLLYQRVF